MKKHTSFKAELGRVLGVLGPYMVLATVIISAALSQGSWKVFFDKTLPLYMLLMGAAWLVLGFYAALKRNDTGVNTEGYAADDDLPAISPTTGMAMPGDGSGGIDMGGNLIGQRDDD